ncbi:MAG: hypothetical protein KY434_07030 [Actinobacteria bacterium]|nr:hypothetical protein [Actinomycetota bacterium]
MRATRRPVDRGSQAGGAGLLAVLSASVSLALGLAAVTAVCDLGVTAGRARAAADAVALAAMAASPLAGGDGDPHAAARRLAAANDAHVTAVERSGNALGTVTGIRDWPFAVTVEAAVTPRTHLVRAIVPAVPARAAARVEPPAGAFGATTGDALVIRGGGGARLLADPRVQLSEAARADVRAGAVDPRVVALLRTLGARHRIAVSVLRSGHSRCVGGGDEPGCEVSEHWHGRGADIWMVGGRAVDASNDGARDLVEALLGLSGPLRPDEVGSPFPQYEAVPGWFSDRAHGDHLHLGYGPASASPAARSATAPGLSSG